MDAGLVATIRKTRGDDIDAACGQLAGQVQDRTKRRRLQRASCRSPRTDRDGREPTMTPTLRRVAAAVAWRPRRAARRLRVDAVEQPRRRSRGSPSRRRRSTQEATRTGSRRSSTPSSPRATTSAGRWTSRSRSSRRPRSSIPTNAQIYNIYGLVYAMLGEDAEGGAEFPARARSSRPNDSEIRAQLGLVPVHARPRRASRSRNSRWRCAIRCTRRRRSRSSTPGKCSVGDRRHRRRRGRTSGARWRARPNNAPAAYNLALLAYRAGAARRGARADEARDAAAGAARPKRSISACASSASSATAPSEASYVVAAAQPLSRTPPRRKAIADGACE